MLDIQPGRSRFSEEVKHLERWLRKPFVSVALDPEWNMGPNGVPGQGIGSVSAKMINRVTRYLTRLVREHDLPQKLVVVHQFTDSMIRNKEDLQDPARGRPRPERRRLRHPRREALEVRAALAVAPVRPLRGVQAVLRGGHEPDEPEAGDAPEPAPRLRRLRVGAPGWRPSPSGRSRPPPRPSTAWRGGRRPWRPARSRAGWARRSPSRPSACRRPARSRCAARSTQSPGSARPSSSRGW